MCRFVDGFIITFSIGRSNVLKGVLKKYGFINKVYCYYLDSVL